MENYIKEIFKVGVPKDPKKYDEWIRKKKESAIKQWQKKEIREKMLSSIRSEANRRILSEHCTEMWKNKEHKKKIKKIYDDPEYKKLASQREKAKWQNPDFKEKMLEIFNSDECKSKQRQRGIERWRDPEYRNLMMDVLKYHKRKLPTLACRTISKIKKKYPLFSKIEEMRYNPDKPGEKEIQVHCKNHNCKNSKEKGGWFTPTGREIEMRLHAIENNGIDNSYFYCSHKCKEECPMYNSKGGDPYISARSIYTPEEKQIWNNQVLEQDNYTCQKCGSKENLHCHHIIPVKIEPLLSLDPDNGIVLCENCHYKYGHKTGTECSTGNLANKICKKINQKKG